MKRFACLCCGLAVLMMAGEALAQPVLTTNNGLAVWYDVRSNGATKKNQLPQDITGTPGPTFANGISFPAGGGKKAVGDIASANLGGPGDAPVLFLSPRLPAVGGVGAGLHILGNKKKNRDFSIGSLFVYATVGDRAAALSEVVSALGRDTQVVKNGAAAKGTRIQGIAVTPNTAIWSTGGVATTVTDNLGNQTDWTISSKAVMVPVNDVGGGPFFSTSATASGGLGIAPVGGVDTLYQVAEVQITAGEWDNGATTHQSPRFATYTVADQVNNLLITRAYDGVGGATPELPDFGYLVVNIAGSGGLIPGAGGAGIPEAATGDGSTLGTTSVTPDAIIVITTKFDSNNDGVVDSGDIADFSAALARNGSGANTGGTSTNRQREQYLYDGNNDRSVDTGDIATFSDYLAEVGPAGNCSAGCP